MNKYLLKTTSILLSLVLLGSCGNDEESFDMPEISGTAQQNWYAGFDASFEFTLIADGKIGDVTADADGATVGVTDVTGVGETTGAAIVEFNAASEGTYNVTVTLFDQAGQNTEFVMTVSVAPQPDPITIAESKVVPDNDVTEGGKVYLTLAGGVEPFTYEWSDGQTTKDVTGLSAGNVSVIVTDAAGQTLEESFMVEDFTGQVVMLDGEENLYTTVLFDGYYWTDRHVVSAKRGDGTDYPTVTNDTAYSVADGEEVVFYFDDWKLSDEVSVKMWQYTEAAAQVLCPEDQGWTLPVKTHAAWQNNPDIFVENGASWSGKSTSDAAKAIFDVENPEFYTGFRRGTDQIAEGNSTWNQIGSAAYVWGQGPSNNPDLNGDVMVWFNGDVLEYWGHRLTGTANCRCVKKAE